MDHSYQRGNVLFYILLAIALLAGLTFAVQQGSRSSATALTEDQARVAATSIIDYGNTVAEAINKLKLRGCSETKINFYSPLWVWPANYTNPTSPTDKSCNVFDVAGGNIAWSNVDSAYLSSSFSNKGLWYTGNNSVIGLGAGAMNLSSSTELIQYIAGIGENICKKINEKSGISGIPTIVWFSPSVIFTGTYTAVGLIDSPDLKGKTYGCFYTNNVGMDSYVFYQVLLVR